LSETLAQPLSARGIPSVQERAVIDITDMTKVYELGDIKVPALRGVSFRIAAGDYVAIMGPSGSGKSTLMNIIGCLDQPTSGIYRLDGIDVANLDDRELAAIRLSKLGFVFQGFNLLARTTALRNVALPLFYAGDRDRDKKAQRVLEKVGLGDRVQHRPNELSGGQQQRVAIARALVNDPAVLLADEPTGNLDSATAEDIMALFADLNSEGHTIIIVTHDDDVASHARRIIRLRDGLVISDESGARNRPL